jgi:hypothetical protein
MYEIIYKKGFEAYFTVFWEGLAQIFRIDYNVFMLLTTANIKTENPPRPTAYILNKRKNVNYPIDNSLVKNSHSWAKIPY